LTGSPRAVWITRAQPGADATAARVAALGLEAIVEPLLEVRRVSDAPIDLTDVSAIAFTSANAVAAFAERCPERAVRVFAVGDATAAAARAQRFSNVLSASGDVTALAAVLTARRQELTSVILYPAAAKPARDLADALRATGLRVRQVTIYETVRRAPSLALIERLPRIDVVLIHSAKAAEALTAICDAHPAPDLIAYCLSPQVAHSLRNAGLAAVASAEAPSEAALLALLGTAGGV
jgi:uroporphyrinogen-III synthase